MVRVSSRYLSTIRQYMYNGICTVSVKELLRIVIVLFTSSAEGLEG